MELRRLVRTGDMIERVGSGATAAEIDMMLMEIARLYRDRISALQTGDSTTIQSITTQINKLKALLQQA